ncbi:hypothetical protein MTR_2g086025 [Medicago truncatula]|uniref:Uncharacterized protein n=1 Tax=Medicago truncatula TaxID=3880 RepID=A0A072VB21_MEDTR|nr:hypothetical protein MTR_2g086025 [Medicago truncatula]
MGIEPPNTHTFIHPIHLEQNPTLLNVYSKKPQSTESYKKALMKAKLRPSGPILYYPQFSKRLLLFPKVKKVPPTKYFPPPQALQSLPHPTLVDPK